MKISKSIFFLFTLLLLACAEAAPHPSAEHGDVALSPDAEKRRGSLTEMQQDIRVGMSQNSVWTLLGDPDVVKRNGNALESWCYEKVKPVAQTEQDDETVTVTIQFGADNNVESFNYKQNPI